MHSVQDEQSSADDSTLMSPEALARVAPSLYPRQQFEQQLKVQPAGIAAVRRDVSARLRTWGRESLADAVTLCLSELLANVSTHGLT